MTAFECFVLFFLKSGNFIVNSDSSQNKKIIERLMCADCLLCSRNSLKCELQTLTKV